MQLLHRKEGVKEHGGVISYTYIGQMTPVDSDWLCICQATPRATTREAIQKHSIRILHVHDDGILKMFK